MHDQQPTILWSLVSPPGAHLNQLNWLHIPFIEISQLAHQINPGNIEEAESVVVTSTNAVPALRPFAVALAATPMVAVGPATARALGEMGCENVRVPPQHDAQGMIDLLEAAPPRQPLIYPRGKLGGDTLLKYFRSAEIRHFSPVVYETRPRGIDKIRRQLEHGDQPDIVVLGSPSAAAVWQELSGAISPAPRIAAIGPVTMQACAASGLDVEFTGSGDAELLVAELLDRYGAIA